MTKYSYLFLMVWLYQNKMVQQLLVKQFRCNHQTIRASAFGYDALTDMASDGYDNSAFGYSAGANITTGDQNTGIGYESLFTQTTGSDNTGLGYKSLYLNSEGDSNIGIGSYAGYYLTGSNNTVIGFQALYDSDITGSNNTVLGAYAGGQSGNSNVLIGYYAGWGNEDSNKLFISSGRAYTGSSSSSETSASSYRNYANYRPYVLIEGDFETGDLIFGRPNTGTTVVKNDFEVQGSFTVSEIL